MKNIFESKSYLLRIEEEDMISLKDHIGIDYSNSDKISVFHICCYGHFLKIHWYWESVDSLWVGWIREFMMIIILI